MATLWVRCTMHFVEIGSLLGMGLYAAPKYKYTTVATDLKSGSVF